MTAARAAAADELGDWDDHVVRAPGGHVYQSMAWARHREASGWEPRFMVTGDGGRVLALVRPWPLLGGGSAYLPRGPIPTGDAALVAERLEAVTYQLARSGIDVVATDSEMPARGDYPVRLRTAGFQPIEEIQPARHRLSLPLGPDADEEAVFGEIAKSTRQRIRQADAGDVAVVRHDAPPEEETLGDGFVAPVERSTDALDRFYDLLLETGERRDFTFGPRSSFVGWWRAALEAGWLILLEARADGPAGEPLAGLLLYRHGGRLSTVHSGDHRSARETHPGALHLLRWRAIQLAIREGCTEMDLGGADVAGARREPREGEPMYGLYQHKRSFGAEWMALAGAHERVIGPGRYAAGRALARVARLVGR